MKEKARIYLLYHEHKHDPGAWDLGHDLDIFYSKAEAKDYIKHHRRKDYDTDYVEIEIDKERLQWEIVDKSV